MCFENLLTSALSPHKYLNICFQPDNGDLEQLKDRLLGKNFEIFMLQNCNFLLLAFFIANILKLVINSRLFNKSKLIQTTILGVNRQSFTFGNHTYDVSGIEVNHFVLILLICKFFLIFTSGKNKTNLQHFFRITGTMRSIIVNTLEWNWRP
jgi:hypothetical protein